MRLAIIGAGLAGANVLKGLISHPEFSDTVKIDIYESREFIGTGLPYHIKEDDSVMLNTPPSVNSQDQDNPDDFIEWLQRNYDEPTNFEGLVARKQYGKYLLEHFEKYCAHEQVKHIRQTVEDLEVLDENNSSLYRLKTNEGWQEAIYDAVFLTIGHPPYNDYYDLKDYENFIYTPYPLNKTLSQLDTAKKIAVVGSGATGIDIMRYLMTHYKLESSLAFFDVDLPVDPITIPYEAGRAKITFSHKWIEQTKVKYRGFISLPIIIQKILDDLAANDIELQTVYERYQPNSVTANRLAFDTHDQELAGAQNYFSQLVPYLPALYNALTATDKINYLKNYHHILDFFKTRVPHLTYKWLFSLLDSKKITLHSQLKDIQKLANGQFQIITEQDSYKTDLIINATGFDTQLSSISEQDQLIKNLFDKGIILPHQQGEFVLVDWPHTRVINQRFGIMKNLFFQGALIGGTQHENNDIGLISRQALDAAKTYMDDITS